MKFTIYPPAFIISSAITADSSTKHAVSSWYRSRNAKATRTFCFWVFHETRWPDFLDSLTMTWSQLWWFCFVESIRVLRCFYKDLMIFFNVVWVSVNGFGLINLRINLRDFAVSEKSFRDSLAIADQEKLINILDDFYSSSFYSLHALRSLRSSTIESYR